MKKIYINPNINVYPVDIKSYMQTGSPKDFTIETNKEPSTEINESKGRGWSEDFWE